MILLVSSTSTYCETHIESRRESQSESESESQILSEIPSGFQHCVLSTLTVGYRALHCWTGSGSGSCYVLVLCLP
jgi:hypothetical protein